jgi:GTP-binding protein EngB required for normal cell division
MPIPSISDHINKKDLELIIEVNRKAIEVETGVADQNEEIISFLTESKELNGKMNDKIDKITKSNDEKLDKVIKQNEELSKEVFKMQVLFITGLISLVIQVVQIFLKK